MKMRLTDWNIWPNSKVEPLFGHFKFLFEIKSTLSPIKKMIALEALFEIFSFLKDE